MNEAYKAKEATIVLGSVLIKVFQLPSGEYRLSQSQVAEALGKRPRSIYEFLNGKSLEALPHKGFDFTNSLAVELSNKPITPIPIPLATSYWRYWDKKGNVQATQIIDGCVQEAIERRADVSFGVHRTEQEYNQDFNLNAAYRDGVSILHQINQLIGIINVNIEASEALNRAVHTLMHNQTTTLRAAHGQARALLSIVKASQAFDGAPDKRLEDMERELKVLGEQMTKILPPE